MALTPFENIKRPIWCLKQAKAEIDKMQLTLSINLAPPPNPKCLKKKYRIMKMNKGSSHSCRWFSPSRCVLSMAKYAAKMRTIFNPHNNNCFIPFSLSHVKHLCMVNKQCSKWPLACYPTTWTRQMSSQVSQLMFINATVYTRHERNVLNVLKCYPEKKHLKEPN